MSENNSQYLKFHYLLSDIPKLTKVLLDASYEDDEIELIVEGIKLDMSGKSPKIDAKRLLKDASFAKLVFEAFPQTASEIEENKASGQSIEPAPTKSVAPKAGTSLTLKLRVDTITFTLMEINGADEIEQKTCVDPFNVRAQDTLTLDDVKDDIYQAISEGRQHTPCYAHPSEHGMHSFLDGSRRRFSAKTANGKLLYWLAEKTLCVADRIFLVEESEKRKQFTVYDWSEYFKRHYNAAKEKDSEVSMRTFAESMNANLANISLLLRFYDLPAFVFDFINKKDISLKQVRKLMPLCNRIEDNGLSFFEIIKSSKDKLMKPDVDVESISEVDKVNQIEREVVRAIKTLSSSPKPSKPVPESLWIGEKKTHKIEWIPKSNNSVDINIRNASQTKMDRIKDAIKQIMDESD